MAETRDWNAMRELSARLLRERTGQEVEAWNQRIRREGFADEPALRAWLAEQGVSGYAQPLGAPRLHARWLIHALATRTRPRHGSEGGPSCKEIRHEPSVGECWPSAERDLAG